MEAAGFTYGADPSGIAKVSSVFGNARFAVIFARYLFGAGFCASAAPLNPKYSHMPPVRSLPGLPLAHHGTGWFVTSARGWKVQAFAPLSISGILFNRSTRRVRSIATVSDDMDGTSSFIFTPVT